MSASASLFVENKHFMEQTRRKADCDIVSIEQNVDAHTHRQKTHAYKQTNKQKTE